MIRLVHLAGSREGQVDQSPKDLLRLGRAPDCDVRFDPALERSVSSHHAELRRRREGWELVDTQSSNGTFVNGRAVRRQLIQPGDVISLGGEHGPQLRFEFAPPSRPVIAGPPPDATVADAARVAVQRARAERQTRSSGHTMLFVVDAIEQALSVRRARWRRWALGLGTLALVVIAVLGGTALHLNAQLSRLIDRKEDIDRRIAGLQERIAQTPPDDPLLPELVAQLELYSGEGRTVTRELERTDDGRKAMQRAGLDSSGDFLDRELRRILAEFDASDVYAVPPHFKQRVQHYLDELKRRPPRAVWERRRRHWPMIQQAFATEKLPETLAYVAWQESHFDPAACSPVGARGMWQFMPATGRRYGLRVPAECSRTCDCGDDDERLHPEKATRAAARYLGDLLAEFGMESFMLAIASYNKGEGGMRRVLREQRLRRRHERDFWHLYYRKLLPEETMEYVPRIIAAAIAAQHPEQFGLE